MLFSILEIQNMDHMYCNQIGSKYLFSLDHCNAALKNSPRYRSVMKFFKNILVSQK